MKYKVELSYNQIQLLTSHLESFIESDKDFLVCYTSYERRKREKVSDDYMKEVQQSLLDNQKLLYLLEKTLT